MAVQSGSAARSLQVLRQNSLSGLDNYKGRRLLIAGGKSEFIKDGDVKEMKQWLPHIEASHYAEGGAQRARR